MTPIRAQGVSWYALPLVLLATTCTDDPLVPGTAVESHRLTSEHTCTVDVAAGTVTCREVREGGGASANLILGTPFIGFVTTSAHERGNAADEDTTTYTLALVNATPQALGTTDGINLAAGGIRVFFTSGPTVSSVYSGRVSSSSIRLEAPDGTATFTNQDGSLTFTDRKYFQYDEVLVPGDTSAAETMWFIYSSNVRSFSFAYRVSAPAQYEHGWITIAPSAVPVLAPDSTATLSAAVYNHVGQPQADGVTWSSSNAAVAMVDTSGVVTAVGEGTATITATSTVNAQRTGSRVITVDAVPGVSATTPANAATNVYPGDNVVITFSEPVNVSANSFTIHCSGGRAFTVSGSGTSTITLNPNSALPTSDTCTVTVLAAQVSDVDANDGPNHLAADYVFSFQTDNEIVIDM